jgi:hypothetical protein
MEWCHKWSPPPKSSRHSCQLARSWQVCLRFKGVIHVDFLPHGVAITAHCYSNLLCNDVRHAIRTWETVKDHHPTVRQHSFTYEKSGEGNNNNNGLENHETLLTALTYPQWFSFNWSNERAPRRTTFQTDDELKCGVLYWQNGQDKTVYAADITNFPERWKKYVGVKGEYLEKR